MLPPSATTENAHSDSAKINRSGIGGASKSVESFLEAVPPVTNGTLLGGGGDELSIGCVKEIGLRIKFTLSRYKLFFIEEAPYPGRLWDPQTPRGAC